MSRIESGKVVLDVEPYRYRDFECSILDVMEQRASDKGVALSLVPSMTPTRSFSSINCACSRYSSTC